MKKAIGIGIGIAVTGIVGLVMIIALIGSALNSTDTSPPTNKHGVAQGFGTKDATADVKLGDMTTPYGTVEIPVTVTNHSSKASDYDIQATVYDAQDNQVDTASTFIQRVEPGGKAHDKLIGMAGSKADHYKLTVVDRTASYK